MDSEIDEDFRPLTSASMVGMEITSFDIPLAKTVRHVWIALDAFSQVTLATWNTEGELRFTKFGSPVLTIPIRRGTNALPAPSGTMATIARPGGSQPGLAVGNPWAGGTGLAYVEIPCWTFEVGADRIALYVKSITDNGNTLFVGGLRVQSQ